MDDTSAASFYADEQVFVRDGIVITQHGVAGASAVPAHALNPSDLRKSMSNHASGGTICWAMPYLELARRCIACQA